MPITDHPTITVHHQPTHPERAYTLHAWDDHSTWDLPAPPQAGTIDFAIPRVADPRKLQLLFHSIDPRTGQDSFEPDDLIRRVRRDDSQEIWSYDYSARILYDQPNPAGVTFRTGDVLTFQVVTQSRFKGGQLYAWNPYDPAAQGTFFPESSRADPVSTFQVRLAAWMTDGFHFKLVGTGADGKQVWEPDASNRVWRPADGNTVWIKSGQVSIRRQPFKLEAMPVELLYPASVGSPPALDLLDPVEQLHQTLAPTVPPSDGAGPFRLARYEASIYPGAVYTLSVLGVTGSEPAFERPFPADPGAPPQTSHFILGADGWVDAFPSITTASLVIEPRPASSFAGGLTVQVGVDRAPAHAVVPASLQGDGTWQASVPAVPGVPNWVRLVPASGTEVQPDEGIETRRFFTPTAAAATYYTHEGVYGLSTRGKTPFADPPSRIAMMTAAFGAPAIAARIFDPLEMPHGAIRDGDVTHFVIHAPHAAWAELVLVNESGPTRRQVPMSLTGDLRYWWCSVPATEAPAGAWYRFALNDDLEVMDPAAREVLDRGNFETSPGEDPNGPDTSWSVVLDVEAIRAAAHATPWQTMGWDALLMYELHPKRFTDLAPGNLSPLDLLADEVRATNRFGKEGYLRGLPVTALQLMPVHEFKFTNSWGYNPAFFFAIDGDYGGAAALARLVNAAHASGRGLLLDLVYNHMNDSPLTQIAREVYRNGDAWGDKINNPHPRVKEFFRQATVYLWRTFGLDGFRFDSTSTIVNNGGWEFLGTLRGAVRAAAAAEGQPWPYFVGENDPHYWDITNPAWGVMDGQWDMAEVSDLGQTAYDPWQAADDHAPSVKADMDAPETWPGRQFAEATRFGESHDSVSGQNPANRRIAARPPLGMGLQMAKAVGTSTLLANGVPMLFMGQEVGETRYFSFANEGPVTNPQAHDLPPGSETDNTHVLAWFRSLMGLRNDPGKGLRGNANVQVVRTGRRTVAFTCGSSQQLFVVCTFGTENQQQDSSWLGLPNGGAYKEIFNLVD